MTATAGTRVAPTAAWSALDRRVTAFSLVAVAVAVGCAFADHSELQRISPAVAAIGIVIGIPHGAMDHLVPSLMSRRLPTRAHLLIVVGVYLAIAAAATLCLLRFPDLSFAVFLVASALHFGWAETTYAAERTGASLPRMRDGWWTGLAHGSVVVVLPLWSAAGQSAMRPLLPTLVDAVAAVPAGLVTTAVIISCGLTVIGFLVHRRVLEAVELMAVLTLFLTVPVFAAFGVYFGLWHAVRHTTRLMDVLAPGEPMHLQFKAFARAAALQTVGALFVLGFLFACRTNVGIVMTGVSVLLALTFPHVVVVAVLDHQRRAGRRRTVTASTDG